MSQIDRAVGPKKAVRPVEDPRRPLSNVVRRPPLHLILRSSRGYLYVLPALMLVILVVYTGAIYTGYVSLLDWNGIGRNAKFVELDNYLALSRDPIFLRALGNTAIFAALTITIQMSLGFTIAALLSADLRFKFVLKAIFFLPVVLAPSVASYVFRQIYSGQDGQLNQLLDALGLGAMAQSWLADPKFALYALVSIGIWQGTGFAFVVYFAALAGMNREVFEAARVDGAGYWQLIRHMALPLLRPTHAALIILSLIGALKTFDIVWLTTGGGPGRATEFMSTYIFKEVLLNFHAGYSAALSMVVFVGAAAITAAQLWLYRRG